MICVLNRFSRAIAADINAYAVKVLRTTPYGSCAETDRARPAGRSGGSGYLIYLPTRRKTVCAATAALRRLSSPAARAMSAVDSFSLEILKRSVSRIFRSEPGH